MDRWTPVSAPRSELINGGRSGHVARRGAGVAATIFAAVPRIALGSQATPPCPTLVNPGEDGTASISAMPVTRMSVHTIKVGLRGTRPPIWRRLEVPSTVRLDALSTVVQAAFGWHGYHLWVFETSRGEFGLPDAELGHRDAATVTLEAVAPRTGTRLRYLYDFGDDWEHDIVVEAVGRADPDASYPRCTAGRRTGPPEDCGGIWGYADLLEVLADPQHDEHKERLEWLGMDSVEDFDPAAFDLAEINRALAPPPRP